MGAVEAVPPFRREIVAIETTGEIQRVKYHWAFGDEPGGDDYARSRVVPVDNTLLTDRWHGIMHRGSNPSKLQERLDRVLYDLAAALTRRARHSSETALVNGQIVDVDNHMEIDGLEAVIRDWLIERAEAVAL